MVQFKQLGQNDVNTSSFRLFLMGAAAFYFFLLPVAPGD